MVLSILIVSTPYLVGMAHYLHGIHPLLVVVVVVVVVVCLTLMIGAGLMMV
jgi:hypothetical protein